MVRRYRMFFPASAAAINSALVELCATIFWILVLYNTTPPANLQWKPVTDYDLNPTHDRYLHMIVGLICHYTFVVVLHVPHNYYPFHCLFLLFLPIVSYTKEDHIHIMLIID